MDECKYNISDCDVNANCTNTYVSYKCTCKAGYTGDGHSCSGTLNFVIQDDHECVSPSTVLAHRYARSSHYAEFSYRLKQIYSVDVVDECRNTSRLYQTLALKAKGNMYNVVLCRYVFEWSDSKNVCDSNTIQTNKSHRPHHCLQIAIIIHHHPLHHHFDHHHYKHFCLNISMNAARKSMFVTWMQSALIPMALIVLCMDGLLLEFPIP